MVTILELMMLTVGLGFDYIGALCYTGIYRCLDAKRRFLMKKSIMILVGTFLLLGLVACGDTPEAAMGDMINIMDGFADNMNGAENADQVVKAMEGFSQGMQDIVPRMKALQDKYPELQKSMGEGKMPKGLEKFEEKYKEVMVKVVGASAKMGQYMNDPKVREAAKKFSEAMSSMK